jgi:sugar lactone lactonase YvrE
MRRRLKHVTLIAAMLVAPSSVAFVADPASAQSPETIDLPEGFQGEGVATGRGGTFYAGSRVDGRIARGDVHRGTSEVFVEKPLVPMATGLKADVPNGLLWVAGAGTGQAAVYDLDTGAGIRAFTFTTETSFINDVVVTHDAAYFTNSVTPVLYRVPIGKRGALGAPETLVLSGPAADFGPGFNLNGIEATVDGRTLIVVNSASGTLYTVDARTGASAQIDLGDATVPTGDGILLVGAHRLLVLQNGGQTGTSQIAVVQLDARLTRGEVVDRITNPLFETATTLARSGGTLVAVNAQFAPPRIDPEPEVVLLARHG